MKRKADSSDKTDIPRITNVEIRAPRDYFFHDFLIFLRSRLNVISTSVYLLRESLTEAPYESYKYIEKINGEIETIRKLING